MRFSPPITFCLMTCLSSQLFCAVSGFIDPPHLNPRGNFTVTTSSGQRDLQSQTIANVIAGQSDLSTFANAVKVANLQSALSQSGTYTTFAPTNEAFSWLNQQYYNTLLTKPWMYHLQELVIFHVTLARALYKNGFSNGMMITMLNLENATVTVTNNPFNVKLTSQYTKESNIVAYDYAATNGVVQKMDHVLFPSFYRTNMMQLLRQYSDFSILVSLIQTVPGLGKTLREGNAITLLAPNNAAWQAMGKSKLASLYKNVNELRSLLQYHMLPIVLSTLQFQPGASYTTMEGSKVKLTVQNTNSMYFNDAKILTVNALARNGIGHSLNKVLTVP